MTLSFDWHCQHCWHTWLRRQDVEPVKCPRCGRLRPLPGRPPSQDELFDDAFNDADIFDEARR